jgi:hypothetical protein
MEDLFMESVRNIVVGVVLGITVLLASYVVGTTYQFDGGIAAANSIHIMTQLT